ncbi:MAG: ankyrin repeat domain-containing protein [Simkaniaceae bacterium]|nr:ankyrin repeat domain-containing protein [Simkaniaceae bacterium]
MKPVVVFSLFFVSTCVAVPPTLSFLQAILSGEEKQVEDKLRENGQGYLAARDEDRNTPLHIAVLSDKGGGEKGGGTRERIIDMLLREGADPNATNRYLSTPLHLAVAANNREGVERLMRDPGTDVNALNTVDMTPLAYAIRVRSLPILKLLLKACNIDPNRENGEGLTPLHLAAKWGYDEAVEILLAHPRIRPEPKQSSGDFIGATPLHYATMQGQSTIAKRLVKDAQYDPKRAIVGGSYEGFTPLHCAVMNPDTPTVFACVKLLIEAGADPSAQTKGGKKPADLTNVRVIRSFLADPDPKYVLRRRAHPR